MAVEYISQPQVFLAPITAVGGIEGAVNITLNSLNITATNISAENAFFGNLVAENIFSISTPITTQVLSSISLSQTRDIEFIGNQRTFVRNFTNRQQGAIYYIINESSNTVTLSSSPTVFIRGGTPHKKFWTWDDRKSLDSINLITWNDSKSLSGYPITWNNTLVGGPYLELPYKTACSLRADANYVSVW